MRLHRVARRVFPVLVVLAAGACGASEDPGSPSDSPSVVAVRVTPALVHLPGAGETKQLSAEVVTSGRGTPDVPVRWSSSDPSVATVSGDGLVTAAGEGEAEVRAIVEGHTGSATIRVEDVSVRYVAIEAGRRHSCGLTSDGVVYCWGSNSHGQLGDGTRTDRSTPVKVRGGLAFRSISATSGSGTCGVTGSGDAYCWGRTEFEYYPSGPHRVAEEYDVARILTGGCVLTSGRVAFCRRPDDYGQAGDGPGRPELSGFAEVAGDHSFATLEEGPYGRTRCGLRADGRLFCWGENETGEVGDGSTTNRHEPVPVASDAEFADVDVGGSHSCAVDGEGVGFCWGSNTFGHPLGAGGEVEEMSSVPVRVRMPGDRFTQIDAGGNHTCAVAEDGTGYCWGWNPSGAVGNGTQADADAPTIVSGDYRFSQVEAGGTHTCALTVSGVAYCWGDNRDGQLGNGGGRSRKLPVLVRDPR